MNRNYCSTITIYNRIKSTDSEDKKEHWNKTVLQNCFWKTAINTGFSGTQASVNNTYVVRIPRDSRYLPYVGYTKEPAGHFTVSQGDIVVLGECNDEITGESGKTVAQLLARNKPNAFKVTAFSDNTSFMTAKHYRLGG